MQAEIPAYTSLSDTNLREGGETTDRKRKKGGWDGRSLSERQIEGEIIVLEV